MNESMIAEFRAWVQEILLPELQMTMERLSAGRVDLSRFEQHQVFFYLGNSHFSFTFNEFGRVQVYVNAPALRSGYHRILPVPLAKMDEEMTRHLVGVGVQRIRLMF